MDTRSHTHEESFDVSPEQMFELLITPSAISGWWGASTVIVSPSPNGVWAAAWGDEDDPDYVTTATLAEVDAPRKLVLEYEGYYSKAGDLPFEFANHASTTFTIEQEGTSGCRLQVEQTGFPSDQVADEFYEACETGWQKTFEGIRSYLESK